MENGRALDVVEQSFDQVAGWREVLESLLVLDADGSAPELVGEAHSGDVHFALGEHLRLGQIVRFVRAEVEPHPALAQPVVHAARLVVVGCAHAGEERRLAQALLEHARRVQEFVGDDGVVHPHAALVEHPQDRLLTPQPPGEVLAERGGGG